jgi:hypothetical protein
MKTHTAQKPRYLNSADGSALLIALGLIVVTSLLVGAALSITQGITRNSNRSQARSTSTQMGLGAIDTAFSSWREIARRRWGGAPTTADLGTIRQAIMADFGSPAGYSIANITVTAVTPQLDPLSGATSAVPGFGPSDATLSYFYLATADVTADCLGGPVTTKVRRLFEKQIISPWNYAIFYDDDLEIHPGPSQIITGWVHTNGVLYTGHSSLTFGSKVTDVRGWSINFMTGDGQHPGETPQSPSYQADIPPAKDTNHQPFGIDPWAVFAPRNADGSNDGWRELIKRPVPGVADPETDARYYNQADIHILVDASNNVTLTDLGGATINSSSTGKNGQLYTVFSGAVTTNTTIQDNREAATIRLVTLDVSRITNAVNNSTLAFNGIVYIADTSAGATGASPKRGVKIVNATSIPNGGLAIVSENPVYIRGNVNTGPTSPPSNTVPDPTQPTASGYTRQPTLIAGDAISLLSTAWSDGNSTLAVSGRKAANTTVNAAILGGIVPTGSVGSNYSGGAENFPRFLEDWGGVYLTYYGSMVCLYDSAQAIGIWGKSNVYNPPTRRWYFDTALRQNPPPGKLTTANYRKDRWWTQ